MSFTRASDNTRTFATLQHCIPRRHWHPLCFLVDAATLTKLSAQEVHLNGYCSTHVSLIMDQLLVGCMIEWFPTSHPTLLDIRISVKSCVGHNHPDRIRTAPEMNLFEFRTCIAGRCTLCCCFFDRLNFRQCNREKCCAAGCLKPSSEELRSVPWACRVQRAAVSCGLLHQSK